jgi:hypothetical protein
MPKLTINDTKYDTDDFNEEQIAMYNEVMIAKAEMNRCEYVFKVLEARCNQLATMIETASKEEEEKEATDG